MPPESAAFAVEHLRTVDMMGEVLRSIEKLQRDVAELRRRNEELAALRREVEGQVMCYRRLLAISPAAFLNQAT